MSDRWLLFELEARPKSLDEPAGLKFFADGETGTWRLFIEPSLNCVDLTLKMVKELHRSLGEAIAEAERDEDRNPEVRTTWNRE